MTIPDADIRQQLRLGEDSRWEFKQVEFAGDRPRSPTRDEFADEMTAFANAGGGTLLCGVTDDGEIHGMTRSQMAALDRLLVEVSTDSIKPALRIDVHHRHLDGRPFLLVEVPAGDSLHERGGQSFIRVGASKRLLDPDERMRLAQRRAQGRYLWHDRQVVPNTGFETLSDRLWEGLLSAASADDPVRGLTNLRLLARDEAGILRATVAGVLLCARNPHDFLPGAEITATHYRGTDRASEQLDSQQIQGPLHEQIVAAVRFVVRNMRVAARKSPARQDVPQYSARAVFEAVVNAVAHRDYSMSSRRIRLALFADRLEIDSPGPLPNGMTIEGMDASQATRNEVIASIFGRVAVGDLPGSEGRACLMERRGDGVTIIRKETLEAAGVLPEYRVVDGSNLVLTIPAARLDPSPAAATVSTHAAGEPLSGVDVLALFPNGQWRRRKTNELGDATFDLHTTHLPMTVYAAAQGLAARLEQQWVPQRGDLVLELVPLENGGSSIFPQSTGHLPGLTGTLNPTRDASDRTYLYADNIAIEEGRQQPVHFLPGKPIRLTDALGVQLSVTVVDILGRSALVEYRPYEP